jgi:hypothetical protein
LGVETRVRSGLLVPLVVLLVIGGIAYYEGELHNVLRYERNNLHISLLSQSFPEIH